MSRYSASLVLAMVFVGLLSACSSTSETSKPERIKPERTRAAIVTGLVASGDVHSIVKSATRYAWHPEMAIVKQHPQLEASRVLAKSKQLINAELGRKGYQLVGLNQQPDFLVGFGLAMESSLSDNQILAKAGLVAGLTATKQQAANPQRYEKGSLVIGLFKGINRQPDWRVLMQGYADFERDKSEQQRNYEATITRMLRAVPAINSL